MRILRILMRLLSPLSELNAFRAPGPPKVKIFSRKFKHGFVCAVCPIYKMDLKNPKNFGMEVGVV